jgi:hypothetical protein
MKLPAVPLPARQEIQAKAKKKNSVSISDMRDFFVEQGRTRIYEEAYLEYVDDVDPRRTKLSGKRSISEMETRGNHR